VAPCAAGRTVLSKARKDEALASVIAGTKPTISVTLLMAERMSRRW
jgi:hypothetical protein